MPPRAACLLRLIDRASLTCGSRRGWAAHVSDRGCGSGASILSRAPAGKDPVPPQKFPCPAEGVLVFSYVGQLRGGRWFVGPVPNRVRQLGFLTSLSPSRQRRRPLPFSTVLSPFSLASSRAAARKEAAAADTPCRHRMLLLRSFRHCRHLGGKHKLLVDRSFSRLNRGEAGFGCSLPRRRRVLGSPQVPTALLLLWPWNSLLRERGGSRTGQIQASMGTSTTFSHRHWSVGSGEWIGRGKRLDRRFLSPWSPGGGLIGLAALPCLAGWRLPLV